MIPAETSKTVNYRNIVDLNVRFRTRDDAKIHLGYDISFLVWFRRYGHVTHAILARIFTRRTVVAIHYDVNVIDNLRLLPRVILQDNSIISRAEEFLVTNVISL